MASDHHHHRNHRPHRLSVPARVPIITTSRPYPQFPSTTTPIPTPSKTRLLLSKPPNSSKPSISFLFFLLFSLRSLYSLFPFLRSSPPSFSLFPFSFLVSLLSFLLSLPFFFLSKNPLRRNLIKPSLTPSQHKMLILKSVIMGVVFLLRFQALRYCGAAAMILAELSGNVAARFVAEKGKIKALGNGSAYGKRVLFGFLLLFIGLFLLSFSWDRIDCFPLSGTFVGRYGFMIFPREDCVRIGPMLLPFLSGFLGCYEQVSMNWGSVNQLGRKWVQLVSLFYTTLLLFVPAVVSFLVFEDGYEDGVSIANLAWPLANTVVFGVLLSGNYGDGRSVSSRDFQREFLVTFVFTIVLELFYFPELSLWGLLLCGLLIYFAVRELDPVYLNYPMLGLESSEPFSMSVMKPIHHILNERKSRKIALFLMINTGYMVVEFVVGFMSNSLGLISDACHMLFDCAALAIGLYASYISRLPANSQFNYGRGRFEVLSGYVNAIFLVLVGALIVLESLERILDPQEISTNSLLAVSIGGLLVNVIGLVFFHEEHHHAHGGPVSCSHSHSHSHSHSFSHHHHDHSHSCETSDKAHQSMSSSHEGHEKKHDNYHHINLPGSIDDCRNGSESHQDHYHRHDNECHNHEHHNQCHHHEDDDHSHHHVHHDHSHQHKQHDHSSLHEHHDHHKHPHHDETHEHHHHHHSSHGSSMENCTNSHSSQSKISLQQTTDRKKSPENHHHHIDHNMEGIFLHVLADTMGSVGVVISTLLIKYKGWLVADPACSIFISVLIVSSVIPLLRNSAEILLQRVPRAHEHNLKVAVDNVMRIKGVNGIQNLHVWSFTNADVVGTLHLHVSAEADKMSLKSQVSHIFRSAGIEDLMLQVDCVK